MSNAAHPERPQFDEVMVPNYSPMSIIPVKGKGSRIWDQSDKDYIDFAGGIAVTCLGHSHPNLIKALVEQGNKLWHLSNVMTNEPALRLAKKLCEHTFADKVYFCNSGGEANEAALKLARRYAIDTYSDQKTEIITFHNAFHGRTFFTVCAGGQAKYSDGFGPKPGDITHIPFNNIEALELAISNRTCAVMIEPIQGEGGILPAEPAFLKRVRELCDKHKALLIMDEVQSGMGRTGKLFAYMQYDVTPDILTSAKGLGGGIPIGAMLTTDPIAKVLTVGTHGSTYGGNPLASAVSEAVLDTLMTPGALDGVDARSKRLVDGLNQLNDKHHLFDNIRGMGMLLGCVLKKQHAGKARDIMQAALAQGALVLMAGGDVVRFAPSLIMTDEEMDEGLKRLDAAFATISA